MERSERIGKYRILQLLATGGMGEVFLARQDGEAGFSKTVVIKKILRHLADDQAFVDMFLNEARLAALLSHHHIVQIFELDQEEGAWFIVMEYVQGRSLRAVQSQLAAQGRKFPPTLAARLCSQALQALHYAHTLSDEQGQPLGLIHRDVCPDNVLVSFGGGVKLVDFGIAKAVDSATATRSGTVKGKYAYVAPEQIETPGDLDGRVDIYGLGVVLFELLTGERPFGGSNESDLLRAIRQDPPRSARALNPKVPKALDAIVERALAKSPQARWASADDMARALERFVQDEGEVLTDQQVSSFLLELFGKEALAVNPATVGAVTRVGRTKLTSAKPAAWLGTAVLERPELSQLPTVVAVEPDALVTQVPLGAEPDAAMATEASVFQVPEPENAAPAPRRPPGRRVSRRTVVALGMSSAFLGVVAAALLVPMMLRPRPPVVGLPPPPPVIVGTPVVVPPGQQDDDEPVALTPDGEAPDSRRTSRNTRRPPPPKLGKVTVRTSSGTEVYYAGRRLGTTPMPAVEVPAGTASFVLRHRQLGVTRKVSVKVPAGGEVVLRADLRKNGN